MAENLIAINKPKFSEVWERKTTFLSDLKELEVHKFLLPAIECITCLMNYTQSSTGNIQYLLPLSCDNS